MIQLTIEAKTIRLSPHEQGLATGAHARAALMPTFLAAIVPRTSRSSMALRISETALGRMIVKYSEQSVFQLEVHLRDFLFVIDDDGSVFVSVEGLPESLRHEVRQLILKVAALAYV
jgi:hypothetical protein